MRHRKRKYKDQKRVPLCSQASKWAPVEREVRERWEVMSHRWQAARCWPGSLVGSAPMSAFSRMMGNNRAASKLACAVRLSLLLGGEQTLGFRGGEGKSRCWK